MNEHHRSIREMDNQVNQHIEMPQIQHTGKVADESVVAQRQISPRTTETKAPEHQWNDRSGDDSRIEIPTLTEDQKALHITSKKETVADDTANGNTSITSRVSQTTLSDFSKNLEEPSPTKKEEAIDDQTRSIDSHEIQCEKEYEIFSTINHGEQINHRHFGKGKRKHHTPHRQS